MQRILVIQTAFIGDVVLATALLEKLHAQFPGASLGMLVRQGNETLFRNHPYLQEVLIWHKQSGKYGSLFQLIRTIRKRKYDLVVNVQRYAATGLLTVLSGAGFTAGFDKNPFSFLFTHIVRHEFSEGRKTLHEIERNQQLIAGITDDIAAKPKLYPSATDKSSVATFQQQPYVCIAPASVWFTKQFPADQWTDLVNALPEHYQVYLLGAKSDQELCNAILQASNRKNAISLAGKLDFLQSAALMEAAVMNYVNDSAPMHFASAMNAPVTVVYCSTVPAFGYGPLSDKKYIIESTATLLCRPCGLHGKKACPETHFNCARQISTQQLLAGIAHA